MASDGGTAPAARPAAFVALLALAMAASTFLTIVFAALAPFLTRDLDLSRTQIGTLTTALYVTGGLLSPVAGPLVDRFGGRRLLVVLFALAGASYVAVAAAGSYLALVAAALFGGIAVALGNPVTNVLVTAHVPPSRQGVATGFKQSGVQAGIFLGGVALPLIAAVAGWRAAAASAIVISAIGAAVTIAVVPRSAVRRVVATARPPLPAGMRWLSAYGFAMGLGISAVSGYLPLYGVERFGLRPALAGWLTSVVGGVGVIARIAWGRAADRRVAPPARSLAIIAVVSVIGGGLLIVADLTTPVLVWVAAAVIGASAAAWNSVGMLAIVRDAPLGVAGRASGVVLLGFYGGYLAGPSAFGAIVDATEDYASGWLFVAIAFVVAAIVALRWTRTGEAPSVAKHSASKRA